MRPTEVALSCRSNAFSAIILSVSPKMARMDWKKGEERKVCVEVRQRSHSPVHCDAGSAVGFSACVFVFVFMFSVV